MFGGYLVTNKEVWVHVWVGVPTCLGSQSNDTLFRQVGSSTDICIVCI